MKLKTLLCSLLLTTTLASTLTGCLFPKEDPEYPELTTDIITDITQTTATSGGFILSDGNADITEKGVCWNQWFTPYSYDSHTSDGTGSGSFTSYITGLQPNTMYYVRAYATNEMGTSYGETQTFTTGTGGGGGNTVTDVDGNTYNTVTIGSQIWMAENLKVTHYRNGDAIPYLSDASAWSSTGSGAYCYYDNLLSNATTYGNLYNWAAVSDSRNIAPTGWHVPTYSEWQTLLSTLGGYTIAGDKLKESGTSHWNSPNNGNNSSGFTALGSGLRDQTGTYFGMYYSSAWWTSTIDVDPYAWGNVVSYNVSTVNTVVYERPLGFPVRCVKD
jgi:uncharacterized protein (TIGR02145 family)